MWASIAGRIRGAALAAFTLALPLACADFGDVSPHPQGTGGAAGDSGGAGSGGSAGAAGSGGSAGADAGGSAGSGGASGAGGSAGSGGASGAGGSAGSSGGTGGSAGSGGSAGKGGSAGSGGSSGTGGASGTGGGGGCTPDNSCQPTSPSSGDNYQDCVDRVNQFRACVCLGPLARNNSGEACVDQEAQYDSTNGAHAGFIARICTPNGMGENECPGWGQAIPEIIDSCLQMMFDEGPGGGHYDNITGHFSSVACGFYTDGSGQTWATQDFYR